MAPVSPETLQHGERDTGAGSRAQPLLYVVFEADRPYARPLRLDLSSVSLLRIGRGAVRALGAERDGGGGQTLTLPDNWLSTKHLRLTRVLGQFVVDDLGSRNGTYVNGERRDRAILQDGDLIECGRTFLLFRVDMGGVDADFDVTVADHPGLDTARPAFAAELDRLRRAARSDVAIVIGGESGTGKELMARAVHALSRRSGALVAVNCGALPATLIESELFGHRRGAFSGATEDRPGLIRSADRGTLFLDEIGDLPLGAQTAFLRVLEERAVMPIGATKAIPVDLRVVVASHRNLEALVREQKFRADLLARLSGFRIVLPSLRERREDFGLLFSAVLRNLAPERAGRLTVTLEAARRLVTHRWPLNIRELDRALRTALALCQDFLDLEHIAGGLFDSLDAEPPRAGSPADEHDAADVTAPLSAKDTALRDQLVALFTEHQGNVSAVARALGKARMQIQRWCKRFGIDPESFRSA